MVTLILHNDSLKLSLSQKRLPTSTAIVKSVSSITKKRVKTHIVQGNFAMAKHSDVESLRKREKIQNHFWNQVGSDEHISLPMLADAIKKEFNCKDDRFVQSQINLMQTEARIRVESRVKVWIKQPSRNL
jgi:hypothetical protein